MNYNILYLLSRGFEEYFNQIDDGLSERIYLA